MSDKDQPTWWESVPAGIGGDAAIAHIGAGATNVIVGKNITQTVYDTLREEFPEGAVGGQYAALATIFWDEYSSSENIAAACGKVVDYAAVHADEILGPLGSGFYGFGQRDYAPEDICPFR